MAFFQSYFKLSSFVTPGAMSSASFTLTLKDTRSGIEATPVRIDAETCTVADLKARLRRDGIVPEHALRCHVAHGGRVLADDELLETLRLVPVAVLAVVLPPPPRSTEPPPPLAPPQAPPPPPNLPPPVQRRAPHNLLLPSRADVAAAWERAFPSAREAAPAAPQQPAPQDDDDDDDEPTCRVCFAGAEAGRLLAPCRCRGSMRHIHEHCLNEWRVRSANPRSFERCDQCGYRYRTTRSRLGHWLRDERLHLAATIAILVGLVTLGALLPLHPERLVYRQLHWHPDLTYPWWGARCDAAVRGLSVPGILGFGESMRAAYNRHRGLPFEQQTWLGVLVATFAADGAPVLRPLLVGGLVYFTGSCAREVRVASARLFTRFGERVEEFAVWEEEAPAAAGGG